MISIQVNSFFIQGILFEAEKKDDLINKLEVVDATVSNNNRNYYDFAGVLHVGDSLGNNIGNIRDLYGFSLITKIKISQKKLKFIKEYPETKEPKAYFNLTKQPDGSWAGIYKLKGTDQIGLCHCFLRPIDYNFFSLKDTWAENLLKKL